MMNTQEAFRFLLNILFDGYAFIVLTRLILQMVRADFYNPISQFTVRATNPILVPLRRIIPGLFGIDFASVVLLLLIECVKIVVLSLLMIGVLPEVLILLFATGKELLSLVMGFFTYAIFLQVIVSWIAGQSHSPAVQILYQVTEPLLRPIRRLLPPFGGLDFSPMVALILMSFLRILLGI